MKKLLWTLALWAATVPAGATVLYKWEATCVSRWVVEFGERNDLGCYQDKVYGLLNMGPDYVPGTFYYSHNHEPAPGPAPRLTIYDPVRELSLTDFPIDLVDFDYAFEATLPVKEGSGLVRWRSWDRGFYPSFYLFEGIGEYYGIEWTGITFRLVPEPATAALFGAGLLGLIGMRRRA